MQIPCASGNADGVPGPSGRLVASHAAKAMERFAAPGGCWCTTCNQRCTLSNEYVYIYIEGHHRAVDVGML